MVYEFLRLAQFGNFGDRPTTRLMARRLGSLSRMVPIGPSEPYDRMFREFLEIKMVIAENEDVLV